MGFIDARDLPEGTEIEADLVIIGGGMAGIAIAREWACSNRRVAVIESGGREFDDAVQDLYRGTGVVRAPGNGEVRIDDYLHQSRFRGLGGSGNVWGGKSVPLDPADFAHRDWLPLTGWPMTRKGLQAYYDRACALLEIPAFAAGETDPEEDRRPALRFGARDFFAAPRRFTHYSGQADKAAYDRFRTDFASAENIAVYLHANVTAIHLARSAREAAQLDIACLNGKRHLAKGRAYVLAVGGIENARLLLASTGETKDGVGNENGLVGRFFQGHVTYGVFQDSDGLNTSLAVSASQPMTLYTDNARDKLHCVIAATLEGQRRFRTGNFTATLFDGDPPSRTDIGALVDLAGLLDGGAGASTPRNFHCFFMSEQFPNPESKVTLDPADVDALGAPRVRLEWVYSKQDLDSLEASVAALAAALGAEGYGRLCWPVDRAALVSIMGRSRHHMGTTRMHRDPESGVVDPDCRVHGLANLYIAGSSVFPTSGIANPTLTLLALAMRLSDHLKRKLGA